jgi:serine phosphatase RsbU (regulator of sigma subunit)
MASDNEMVEKLSALNRIAEGLNQAVDVNGVLEHALADLIELMGLETGWITLQDGPEGDGQGTGRYILAAHHNLPPALAADRAEAWGQSCTCRDLWHEGRLTKAYNEVRCSRLSQVQGDRRGLTVHASAPLRSGDRILGILNVAAPDWSSFSSEALGFLTNVGSQMGIALERAQLFDLMQERRIHEQAALLNFSQQLLARSDLDDLMQYLVSELRQLLHADACALLLPGEEPEFLELRAFSGWRVNPGVERKKISANGNNGPGMVMRSHQLLVIEDVQHDDPGLWLSPWLQAEEFRAYAMVPLTVEDSSVGVLMISQRKPWVLQEDDLRSVRLMANQAAIAIEKARLHQREIRMHGLEKELEVGRQIQLSLLPHALPVVPGWEFAAYYQAAREVGGDFYDCFRLPGQPERLALVIADATGKGVPAALFMVRGCTMIRSTAMSGLSPSEALAQVNDMLLQDRQAELYLTSFHGLLDTASGHLVYANAGHTRPVWIPASANEPRELAAQGFLLGAMAGIELEECQVDIEPGDLLIFYTDGVTEAMNAEHEFFAEDRLFAVVGANHGASAHHVLETIVDAVRAFAGDVAQSDDLTLLVVRRCPPQEE